MKVGNTRRRVVLASALGMVALAAPSSPARAKDGPDKGAWPFGAKPGAMAGADGLDLYNLGVLGAKASNAEGGPAKPRERVAGVSRFERSNDPGADVGPARMIVDIVFDGGPADKAGLKKGDVIVGVGGKPFAVETGSLAPIADAVVAAESGATKGVELLVERVAGKPPITVKASVPVVGPDAADPLSPKRRRAVLDAALAWLAQHQSGDGGFPETTGGRTSACVQTSLAGLAWIAGGSTLVKGPHAKNLKKAFEFLQTNAGVDAMPGGARMPTGEGGAPVNWNQTTWGVAHAAIFAAELVEHSPSDVVTKAVRRWADDLVKRQETTGGWGHGPGGKNGLGYIELNIVASLSMLGMGMAKQTGWTPPTEPVARAKKYLEDSSGGDGGVGYSTEPGQQGQGNIGRTAATWLGCKLLGFGADPFCVKMETYVKEHAGDVFDGHASLMQHFLLGGLGAHAQGGDALKAYWAKCRTSFVLARAPDGSFQPRPWKESIGMGSNTDVGVGEPWTTACWAIVAGCRPTADAPPALPLLLAQAAPAKPK